MTRVPGRLLGTLKSWIIRYYVTLQLNSNLIAPEFVRIDQIQEPAPIIRSYASQRTSVWDARELVVVRDEVGVLTVPIDSRQPRYAATFQSN